MLESGVGVFALGFAVGVILTFGVAGFLWLRIINITHYDEGAL